MGDHRLGLGAHVTLRIFEALLVHLHNGLADAGHEGRDGGDQADGEKVVARAGQVGGDSEVGGDALGEVGGELVDDVDAPGEGEEGNGEVDGGGVDWLAGGVVSCVPFTIFRSVCKVTYTMFAVLFD